MLCGVGGLDLTSKTLISSRFWPGNSSRSGYIFHDLLDIFIFHPAFLYILSRRLAEII